MTWAWKFTFQAYSQKKLPHWNICFTAVLGDSTSTICFPRPDFWVNWFFSTFCVASLPLRSVLGRGVVRGRAKGGAGPSKFMEQQKDVRCSDNWGFCQLFLTLHWDLPSHYYGCRCDNRCGLFFMPPPHREVALLGFILFRKTKR